MRMSPGTAEGHWDLVNNWVSEALAFHPDGRPLGRYQTGSAPQTRVDPMAPDVIAFQGMIQDALGDRGRPVSAVYGERVLSMVPGRLVHVAAVLRGRPDHELRDSMRAAVDGIESRWGPALADWSGVPGELDGLPSELVPVVARTTDRGPGEVEDPPNARGVFPVSSVDFHGGRARFKVGVYSSGFIPVRGAFMELTFGRDLLRLEGSQPGDALTEEGSVSVGTISAGESKSVACLLEPMVPGRHLVEATLTFFDDANNPRHLEVPKREFDVVFPHLSVDMPLQAMGRGAVAGTDEASRAWSFPASLGGLDVMRVARTVLGTRGLVLSSGEEERGPPPVWTVEGGAMAGPAPLKVGLRVIGGDVRRLELTAASTDAGATAGAVAEMRKLLEEAFFKRWRGQVSLVEDASDRRREAPIPETDIDTLIPAR